MAIVVRIMIYDVIITHLMSIRSNAHQAHSRGGLAEIWLIERLAAFENVDDWDVFS